MNEYSRLAKLKPIEARNYSELIAACFGLDDEKSKPFAEALEAEATLAGALSFLKSARLRTVGSRNFAELIQEIAKRKNPSEIVRENLPVIQSMNDIVSQAVDLRGKKKEYLLAFFLNARHQLISKEIISIGTLTASLAHPREIFSPAIGKAAAGVILVHNHPSGDPSPSDEDMRLTKRIVQAGHIMGIDLLDHLIVAESGCYSFKAAGAL